MIAEVSVFCLSRDQGDLFPQNASDICIVYRHISLGFLSCTIQYWGRLGVKCIAGSLAIGRIVFFTIGLDQFSTAQCEFVVCLDLQKHCLEKQMSFSCSYSTSRSWYELSINKKSLQSLPSNDNLSLWVKIHPENSHRLSSLLSIRNTDKWYEFEMIRTKKENYFWCRKIKTKAWGKLCLSNQ